MTTTATVTSSRYGVAPTWGAGRVQTLHTQEPEPHWNATGSEWQLMAKSTVMAEWTTAAGTLWIDYLNGWYFSWMHIWVPGNCLVRFHATYTGTFVNETDTHNLWIAPGQLNYQLATPTGGVGRSNNAAWQWTRWLETGGNWFTVACSTRWDYPRHNGLYYELVTQSTNVVVAQPVLTYYTGGTPAQTCYDTGELPSYGQVSVFNVTGPDSTLLTTDGNTYQTAYASAPMIMWNGTGWQRTGVQ